MCAFVFSGNNVKSIFGNEVGVHRFQRIPPTEKRGRVHTSSITVAVLDKDEYHEVKILPHEVSITYSKGTGAGGQNRDKNMSCVIITHLPTGIKASKNSRHQHKNKEAAMEEITKRVNYFYKTGHIQEEVDDRRDQIGKGNRGDKRRTYRVKDNIVIDHVTGKTARYKDIIKGKITLLN